MMILIRLLISFGIIYFAIPAKGVENKILFSIKKNVFTSIDLENRRKYISIIDRVLIEDSKNIKDDFISSLLFHDFFKNNYDRKDVINTINDKFNKILSDYQKTNIPKELLTIFNSLSKAEIKKNIEYDLYRRIIIEQELQGYREKILKDEISNYNNIYNIEIKYVSVNNKFIKNKYDLKNLEINLLINQLNKESIDYIYEKKAINFSENIAEEIKEAIINNKNYFKIENEENIIIGNIVRKLKDIENIKLQIIQILTNKELESKKIKCNYLEQLKENQYIKINNLEPINYSSINDNIKDKLIKINDFIKINEDGNIKYFLLCDIIYNNKNIEDINVNIKIDFYVNKIENEFINFYKKETNFKMYD